MSQKQMNLFGKRAASQPSPVVVAAGGPAKVTAKIAPPKATAEPLPTAESLISRCSWCKEQKETEWVNGGRFAPNQQLCRDCIPKFYAAYGYQEPGFRIIGPDVVEIFSATTGWERIKTYWVKGLRVEIFENSLFPLSVRLEHEEIRQQRDCRLDHATFGITWASGRFLSARTGVPMPILEKIASRH